MNVLHIFGMHNIVVHRHKLLFHLAADRFYDRVCNVHVRQRTRHRAIYKNIQINHHSFKDLSSCLWSTQMNFYGFIRSNLNDEHETRQCCCQLRPTIARACVLYAKEIPSRAIKSAKLVYHI